ncbi:MAG: serine hydrolase [Cellvibrionaceae bacterium]
MAKLTVSFGNKNLFIARSILIICLCVCTNAIAKKKLEIDFPQTDKTRDYWPTQVWAVSSPEEQNIDSVELFKAVEHIYQRHPDIYSLLVIKNGYLILENYYKKGRPNRGDWIHSVTKSYMSTLVGIAIDKGFIKNVDQTLFELLPRQYTKNMDSEKKSITLKSLLTMTAGFRWRDWGDPMMQWFLSPDWTAHTLQLEQVAPQGKHFFYNTTLSHLLSVILTEASHMSTEEFAERYLFKPLGMTIHEWITDPQGNNSGGYGLKVTPRDMAKLGYLFLNNGLWDGKQIVSSAWVKDATRSADASAYGYGYQWWIKPVGNYSSYQAIGRRGQNIVIVPDQDLVIVATSETAFPHSASSYYPVLYDMISESIDKSYLATVPRGIQQLFDQYTEAMVNNDLEKLMSHFSENYYHSGLFFSGDKQTASSYYRGLISRTALNYTITKFKRQGDIAYITGVKSGDGLIDYPVEEQLILEQGQWKFYGNQYGKSDNQ